MHVKVHIECTGIQMSEDRERRKSLRIQAQRPRIDAETDPVVAVPTVRDGIFQVVALEPGHIIHDCRTSDSYWLQVGPGEVEGLQVSLFRENGRHFLPDG